MRSILYSHGFGVDETGRGLFTDLAAALPAYDHIMFGYDSFDKTKNLLTVSPVPTNARLLSEKYETHKDGVSILIAHSQGCVSAAMAQLNGIERAILIAPPTKLGTRQQRTAAMMRREGTIVNDDGSVLYPRRDGSTTLVTNEYIDSNEAIDPIGLYNQLAVDVKVTVIRALEDEVLSDNSLTGLDTNNLTLINLPGNHDFRYSRDQLIVKILAAIADEL